MLGGGGGGGWVANVLFLYIFVGMYLQHFVLVQSDTLTF